LILSEDEKVRIIIATEKALYAAFELFKDTPEWRGRKGGYLCVLDPITELPVLHVPIGILLADKVARYRELSLEKARRLARAWPHFSSYETRDPAANRYGGAIRTGKWILSFSGLPELADEALMIAVAIRMKFIDRKTHALAVNTVMQKWNPEYLSVMLPKFCFAEWYGGQELSTQA
jgi:hypothetical protein